MSTFRIYVSHPRLAKLALQAFGHNAVLLLDEAKLMFSTLDDPEHWLWQEKEARTSAEFTAHTKAREILLRLADDYRKRAERAEKRRRERSLSTQRATF
jgi:hypothetical protein